MRRTVLLLLSALALVALFISGSATGEADGGSPALGEGPHAGFQAGADAGESVSGTKIVVRYKAGVSAVVGMVRSSTVADGAIEVMPRSQLHVIETEEGDRDAVIAALRQDPLVAEVGASRVVRAFDAPNDTNYSYQWSFHNTVGGIHAEAAWPLAPERGQDVVVAVIDTGVAYEAHDGSLGGVFPQHFVQAPDLATTAFVSPWDFVNDDAHANDDNGHGSHVTGTITQDTNNSYGVAGVAYNSTIMPVKVLDYGGFGEDADLVEAIYYAVDEGADVINMSLGFSGTGTPNGGGVYCTEIVGLNAALDYADTNDVVVIAAAGNDDGAPVSCPGAYPTVISVAASRYDGQVVSYSNGGETLDVTAPGGDSTVDQNGDTFSDGVTQETYCYDWLSLLFLGTYDEFCDIFMSGTSMATPHVSGLAALLLGEDPTLTPDEVRSYVESTARDRGDAGWDESYGWGVIDAEAALTAFGGGPPATATFTPTPTATATPTATPCPDLDGDTVCDGVDPDTDGDGCPNVNEQQTAIGSEMSGGRRDYLNANDYFNPTHDGINRVDDVLAVIDAYFVDDDDGNPGLPPYAPGYDPDTDRTYAGPEAWNLGPPNGLQRVDDVLNQVKQYFHDCG